MKGHNLNILCLRDLDAMCSCGHWSLLCCSVDGQTTEQLRAKALYYHNLHVANVRRQERARRLARRGY